MAYTDTVSTLAQSFASSAWQQVPESARNKLEAKTEAAKHKVSRALIFTHALYRTLYVDEPIITEIPRATNPTPPTWQKNNITVAGYNSTMTEISNDSETDTVIFVLGHNTESEYYVPFVDRLSTKRPNMMILELPYMNDQTHHANGKSVDMVYQEFVTAALLKANSNVLKRIPEGHRITIITHSGSAQSFERGIRKDAKCADFALKNYNGRIHHTGIMLDTVKSSMLFNPFKSLAYLWLSSREKVSPQRVGTTRVDRTWIEGDDDIYDDDYKMGEGSRNPTHGQAHHFKRAGMGQVFTSHLHAFCARIPFLREINPSFFKLERTIHMGLQEPCTSTRIAKHYERLIGGVTTKAYPNARHSPAMECAGVYRDISRSLRQPSQTMH